MFMMPPYNRSLRQVADDIDVEHSTVYGWRTQLEMKELTAHKDELTHARIPEQIFSIRLETGELEFGWSAIMQLISIDS
ncbi:hypothetical protein [Yersinia enterocolitica]|uniref:hypothetical protein n=1 Tax=Yersinia enterocolitica TaxID=630 RepID=UPI003D0499EC